MERDHYLSSSCPTYTYIYKYICVMYAPIYFSAEKDGMLSLLLFMLLVIVSAILFSISIVILLFSSI